LQGGHFSGINRKVQLKPLRWGLTQGQQQDPVPTGPAGGADTSGAPQQAQEPQQEPAQQPQQPQQQQPQQPGQQPGEPPAQGQAQQPQGPQPVLEEALLILKWGGVLTHAGRKQAEDLGRVFRLVMYPT
jgi:hypothetical protein